MINRKASARTRASVVAVAQHSDLTLEGTGHAAGGSRAGFRQGAVGRAARNVNVMPRTRFRPRSSQVVGPGGSVRYQIEPLARAVTGERGINGLAPQSLFAVSRACAFMCFSAIMATAW